MLSVPRLYSTGRLMDKQGQRSWPNQGAITEYPWKDWGTPQKSPVRIDSVLTKIQTDHLLNTGLEHHLGFSVLQKPKICTMFIEEHLPSGILDCCTKTLPHETRAIYLMARGVVFQDTADWYRFRQHSHSGMLPETSWLPPAGSELGNHQYQAVADLVWALGVLSVPTHTSAGIWLVTGYLAGFPIK